MGRLQKTGFFSGYRILCVLLMSLSLSPSFWSALPVELAEVIEPDKVAQAYRKIQIDSVEGPVHHGPALGTQSYSPVPMTRIENGKPRMLGLFDPKPLSEADYLALGKP